MKFGDWALFLACAQQGKIAYLNDVMATYRIHPGGKWSGRSLDDQLQDATIHFEKVNRVFNSKFDKLIRKGLSRVYYSFALKFEAANESEKAKACASKSLEKNPFNARSRLFFHTPKAFQLLRRLWYSWKQPAATEVGIYS